MTDRIREHSLTGVTKPPVARMLRQHLGFVTKFVGDEAQLVETNDEVIQQHLEALRVAIAVLQAALVAQEARP
jgi:NAD kinase